MTPALRGHLAMLVFSALVAGSFALGSLAANEIAPTALNALRFVLSAAIVGAVMLATRSATRDGFRAPWRYLLLGGIFAIYFVLMFEGLKTAPPVSTAAVFTLTPIIAGGFGWLLLRQVTTPRMVLALAIGGVGALWVIFRADIAALRAFDVGRGEVIYFFGCIAHALYTPLSRKLNRGESAVQFAFGVLVAGAIVLFIWGAPELLATPWSTLPAIVWITLIYLSVFASSVTFVLLQYATLRLPSAKVMAYTYLTPSWVVLWQLGLGKGAPPILILAGVALTVLALALLLKDQTRSAPAAQR
ncbi:MAG: drug/metabolite transporter (DMT)-like permease [Sulfitobacter sp.]